MKKEYQSIWKESKWSFQARELIEGLRMTPQNAKIVLFLRHSHRKETNDAKELRTLRLTEMGREIAKIFGSLLPKEKRIRTYHSPSPRCVETAELINEGFREIGGKSAVIGTYSPLNEVLLAGNLIASEAIKHPGFEFIKRWRDGCYSSEEIVSLADYSRKVYDKTIETLNNGEKGTINIHVSHDIFVIALREGFFDFRSEGKWCSFLGGFAICLDTNQYSLLDLDKARLEPIQASDKNNIPILELKKR
ncbi:MAG: histidine phosphatase family protein [Candidatus Lokiarchaeota archaeon]|nr:histidine phosphatase family protein [Candidatus Lokiarchaeota archaeon]